MTDAVTRKIEDDDAEWLRDTMPGAYDSLENYIAQGCSLDYILTTIHGWGLGGSSWRDRCKNAARSLWRREERERTKPLSLEGES